MKKQINIEKMLFIAVGIIVITYAVLRAYYVPFTADEAGSFYTIDILGVKLQDKVVDGTHTYLTIDLNGFSNIRTANTHYLNSFLMKICSLLFGNSEISLRLPNLAALFFYILFSWRLVGFIDNRPVRVCGFLLLNLNPFLLDFFSLARGYGMATSLIIISLYYFISYVSGNRKVLLHAYLFAILAAYANFIAFNYYVAILMLHLLLIILQNGFSLSALVMKAGRNKSVAVLNIVFLAITLPFLLLQTSTNQFYIGGDSVYHVFYSLSISSLYEKVALYALAHGLAPLVLCLSILLCIINARRILQAKSVSYKDVPFMVLISCISLCILQHVLLKLPLPEGRTGIYFIPLFTVAVVFSYLQIGERLRRYFRPIITTIAFLSVVNFANSMNLRYAVYSVFDANAKEAYNYFKREAEQKEGVTKVNAHWFLTGAMYYYHLMDNKNEKLDIVTIWPSEFLIQDTTVCYYYFFDTMKVSLPSQTETLLKFDKERASIKLRTACMQ